jgi:cytochrome c-type biogenesis protein CcmE
MPARFGIGAVIILGALAVIAMVMFHENRELYFTVDEYVAGQDGRRPEGPQATTANGPIVQVRGDIDYDSVTRVPEYLELRFALVGEEGRLPVVYHGVVPDTFDRAGIATVAGRMGVDGVFVADRLIVQCPSKYKEASPEADGHPTESAARDRPLDRG